MGRRSAMEKHILRWSYWLGIVFVVAAVVIRVLNMFGMSPTILETRGNGLSYHSFVDLSILSLLVAIATAGVILSGKQNP
jgi:hypothetical protein